MVRVIEDFSGQVAEGLFYEIAVPLFDIDIDSLSKNGYTIYGLEYFGKSASRAPSPRLESCPTDHDGWHCHRDPEHTWGGWTEFQDPWLLGGLSEPEIDFIPCMGAGGGEVVGQRLASEIVHWGLRGISIIELEGPLDDPWSPCSKRPYYWIKTYGVIRVRPPKVLDGPNCCQKCGWGPVVCPACGYIEGGLCPGCDSLLVGTARMAELIELEEPPQMWQEALPGHAIHDQVLLGKTWNGGDFVGGRGPRVISRRLYERLREFGAKPLAVKPVAVDIEGMSPEQWAMLNEP